MKKRPLIVLLFSAACALFPLYLLVQTMLLRNASFLEAARILPWSPAPLVFAGEDLLLVALVWATAFAVYQVRSWSWWLALGVFGAVAAHAIGLFLFRAQLVSDAHMLTFTFLTAAPVVALIVLLQREIRAPYFNPRIRWWEAEPRYPVEASLRGGGRVLDISRLGIFVQQESPLETGERGEWVLEIDGREIPIKGEVAWVSQGDAAHPSGFGIRFAGLGNHSRQTIEEILEQQRRLGKKEWGERGVRHPTDIRCGADSMVLDISAGGMFVHTRQPRSLGATVEYPLRHGRHELTVTGRVVWISHGSGAYPPGHGVRFTRLDSDTRATLNLLIRDLWQTHSKPVPRYGEASGKAS